MKSLKELSIKKYIDIIPRELYVDIFNSLKEKISEDKYNIVINIDPYKNYEISLIHDVIKDYDKMIESLKSMNKFFVFYEHLMEIEDIIKNKTTKQLNMSLDLIKTEIKTILNTENTYDNLLFITNLYNHIFKIYIDLCNYIYKKFNVGYNIEDSKKIIKVVNYCIDTYKDDTYKHFVVIKEVNKYDYISIYYDEYENEILFFVDKDINNRSIHIFNNHKLKKIYQIT